MYIMVYEASLFHLLLYTDWASIILSTIDKTYIYATLYNLLPNQNFIKNIPSFGLAVIK